MEEEAADAGGIEEVVEMEEEPRKRRRIHFSTKEVRKTKGAGGGRGKSGGGKRGEG